MKDRYGHKMSKAICAECGKEIWVRSYRLRKTTIHYCGRSCQGKAGSRVTHERYPDYSKENNPNWRGGISLNATTRMAAQRERYLEHIRARELAHNARRRGELVPEPCEHCGADDNIHGHHEDYESPLKVSWLCEDCHQDLHV